MNMAGCSVDHFIILHFEIYYVLIPLPRPLLSDHNANPSDQIILGWNPASRTINNLSARDEMIMKLCGCVDGDNCMIISGVRGSQGYLPCARQIKRCCSGARG